MDVRVGIGQVQAEMAVEVDAFQGVVAGGRTKQHGLTCLGLQEQ